MPRTPSNRARRTGEVAAMATTLLLVTPLLFTMPTPASGAAPTAATAAPWPMYGRDAAHTGSSPAWGPSSQPDVAWSVPLTGAAEENASPVVAADGTIFVPTATAFHAIAPDGTVRWTKWGTDEFDATATWSAPAIAADGTVYVWRQTSVEDPDWPGGKLHALDPDDGATRWAFETGEASYGSPTVGADGTIYMGASDERGRLSAIRADGTLRWTWQGDTDACGIETSPAIAPSGDVYVVHNCEGLVALDPDGDVRWSRWDVGEVWNSPTLAADGTILVGATDGFFHAVRPEDGTDRWTAPVQAWLYKSSAAISADGSTIMRGDNDGIVYGFGASGGVRWTRDTGTGEALEGAPATTANGVLFIPAGGSIVALRVADGSPLWTRSLGEWVQPPAVGQDGTLYVVAGTGGTSTLYAFGCGTDADGDGHGDACADLRPAVPTIRLQGDDRYATAVAISQASHPTAGGAAAAVLARGDDPSGFADALSGTPLARAKGGPVLTTPPDHLAAVVADELRRLLAPGATVWLLGGEAALSTDVAFAVAELGFDVQRLWGATRYDTALAVADELAATGPVLVTIGDNFPDALAAGAAAVHHDGTVLLTPTGRRWPALDAWLTAHAGLPVYAVGGPAARSYTEATGVSGSDRFATAVAVAERFFDDPATAGIARSDRFPDALAGGAHIGALGGPILLTPSDVLELASTGGYLCAAPIRKAVLYGGPVAISTGVETAVAARVDGTAC